MKDPGLQPERTSLAWNRTVLSMLVCAGIFLKIGTEVDRLEIILAGIAALSGSICLFGAVVLRARQLTSQDRMRSPSGFLIAATAWIPVVCAGLSAIALLF